jgi:rSAM/selenodomain-associated transferase 1
LSHDSKQALLIFTRNPEPGKCKTRLAATIGDAAALTIYTFLLQHTAKIARRLEETDKHVYFSEYLGDKRIWEPETFRGHVQQGDDLGERMQRAFAEAFEAGYQKVVLIGSDLYDLDTEDLASAFASLDTHQAVVGPATDGGYYLLGLTQMVPALFRNKAWGTDTVLEATLHDLEGIPTYLLPPRNDIDRYEDIAGNPIFVPFLKTLPND